MTPRLYSSIILLSCSCARCFIAPTWPTFYPQKKPIPIIQSRIRHHNHERSPSDNNSHNYLANAATKIPKDDIFQLLPLSGIGLTSILPQPQKFRTSSSSEQILRIDDCHRTDVTITTFVGTKRGKLMQLSLHLSNPNETSAIPIENFNEEIDLKPYPIFSMASLPYDRHHYHHSQSNTMTGCKQIIFTGGADRFISVWEEESAHAAEESTASSLWKIKERLGPHTGWVKAIASLQLHHHNDDNDLESHFFLFSIGCNRIEVWKSRREKENYDGGDDRVGSYFMHFDKLQVGSSVELGCTLSSDLLCLAIHQYCGNQNDGVDIISGESTSKRMDTLSQCELMAGGVDGRIHRWRMKGTSIDEAEAASAHEGRVNGIVICRELNALVSIGNDGFLVCWKINKDESMSAWPCAKLCLNHIGSMDDESGGGTTSEETCIKLQSMCIIRDDMNESIVAIGSACGRVMLVRVTSKEVNCDGKLIPELISDSTKKLADAGVIHALQFYQGDDAGSGILLVGCSGVFLWKLDFDACSVIC